MILKFFHLSLFSFFQSYLKHLYVSKIYIKHFSSKFGFGFSHGLSVNHITLAQSLFTCRINGIIILINQLCRHQRFTGHCLNRKAYSIIVQL